MAAGLHAGCSYHGVWVQTEEACTSEWALDLLPREPAVTAIAEQLRGVGSMVVPAGHLPEDPALGPHTTGQGTRGIYCTLPSDKVRGVRCSYGAVQMVVVGLTKGWWAPRC